MSADHYITDSDMKVVADAIRAKGKTTEPLTFPDGMKTAIDNIQSGVEFADLKPFAFTLINEKVRSSTSIDCAGIDGNDNYRLFSKVDVSALGTLNGLSLNTYNYPKFLEGVYRVPATRVTSKYGTKTTYQVSGLKIDKRLYDYYMTAMPDNSHLRLDRMFLNDGHSLYTNEGRMGHDMYIVKIGGRLKLYDYNYSRNQTSYRILSTKITEAYPYEELIGVISGIPAGSVPTAEPDIVPY